MSRLSRIEKASIAQAVAFLSLYSEDEIIAASKAAVPNMGGASPAANDDPGGADDVALQDQNTDTAPAEQAEAAKPDAEPAKQAETEKPDPEPGDEPAELKIDDVLAKFGELVPLGDNGEGRKLGGLIVKFFKVAKVRAIPAKQWGDAIERVQNAIEGIEAGDDLDTIAAPYAPSE